MGTRLHPIIFPWRVQFMGTSLGTTFFPSLDKSRHFCVCVFFRDFCLAAIFFRHSYLACCAMGGGTSECLPTPPPVPFQH